MLLPTEDYHLEMEDEHDEIGVCDADGTGDNQDDEGYESGECGDIEYLAFFTEHCVIF